jgi:hypothetical protein
VASKFIAGLATCIYINCWLSVTIVVTQLLSWLLCQTLRRVLKPPEPTAGHAPELPPCPPPMQSGWNVPATLFTLSLHIHGMAWHSCIVYAMYMYCDKQSEVSYYSGCWASWITLFVSAVCLKSILCTLVQRGIP